MPFPTAADMQPSDFAALTGYAIESIGNDLHAGRLASVRKPGGAVWVAASAVQAAYTKLDAMAAISVPGTVLTNSTRAPVSMDTYARIVGRSVEVVGRDVARGAIQGIVINGTVMVKGGELDVFYYRRTTAGYASPADPDPQSPQQ